MIEFATDAGYWPWAAIVVAATAVLVFALRRLYPDTSR
jgi:anti-sigma-K factor RskA